MNRAPATAKLNLALVVGPLREDRRHEVATVLQRIDLADRVSIEPADELWQDLRQALENPQPPTISP